MRNSTHYRIKSIWSSIFPLQYSQLLAIQSLKSILDHFTNLIHLEDDMMPKYEIGISDILNGKFDSQSNLKFSEFSNKMLLPKERLLNSFKSNLVFRYGLFSPFENGVWRGTFFKRMFNWLFTFDSRMFFKIRKKSTDEKESILR